MIEKDTYASTHARKGATETHIRKHLHLTSSIHLKHGVRMEGPATSMKADASSSSQPLMQKLGTLQKSSVFNDPPMSPSCKNSSGDIVIRRRGNSEVSSRGGNVEIDSFSINKDEPILTEHTKMYPNKRSKQGIGAPQRERKFRATRLKIFSKELNKGARSTGLSAGSYTGLSARSAGLSTKSTTGLSARSTTGLSTKNTTGLSARSTTGLSARSIGLSARNAKLGGSSSSLQGSKCLTSAKEAVALPPAKGLRVVDIGGLPESECTSSFNWSRVHSRGNKETQDLENIQIELGVAEYNADLKPTENIGSLHTSCNRPSPLGLSTLATGWISRVNMKSHVGIRSDGHVSKNEDLDTHSSLSVKYAPKSFHDILGQQLVTQALSNALFKRRVAPMYIFYGPPGTGKTSCARLFALALNCLSIWNDRPCRSCRLCLAQISGKFSPMKEAKSGRAYGVKGIASLMKDISWSSSFLYKVFLVDDCQALSAKAWNTLRKGMKGGSKRTVFIFNTVSLEHIPHAVASRCQKFRFSTIRERDIVNKLQMIAFQENLDADIEAIKLIASACNGSLYDAERMLDHISLLGDKVRVPIVRDLMGLISDSSLMELLDAALSADIADTVQNLKAFSEASVEPLNLISQLASLITRILAGGYHAPKRKCKSKFFQRKELTKGNMQSLRQALRILSEAEKQVRGSSSGMTWLIAALLQFAPEGSYIVSSCPPETSHTQSLAGGSMDNAHDTPKESKNLSKVENKIDSPQCRPRSPTNKVIMNAKESQKKSTADASFQHLKMYASPNGCQCSATKSKDMPWIEAATAIKHLDDSANIIEKHTHFDDNVDIVKKQISTERDYLDLVFQRVLDAINSTNLKSFLQTQGKLVSLSFHKDLQEAILEFHHLEHLSRVQRSKASILHAFQATLGHHVKVKVRLVLRKNKHRAKEANWKPEASKLDTLQGATLMSGSGRINSNLSSGGIGDGHAKMETRETDQACEGHIVYETVPRFLINPRITNGSNERLQIVSMENIEVGKLPNTSKHMPHEGTYKHALHEDTYKQVWPKGTMQMEGPHRSESNNWNGCTSLDTGGSLSYVGAQAEGSKEGCSLDLQFDHMNATLRRDSTGQHVCINSQKGRSSGLVPAEVVEENLRMESTSKENVCWKAANSACKAVCLSFSPCAIIPRPHETL